ncbi:MAG: hypothetical protein ACLGG5_00170 [Thermoleophilia bacterium]
MKGVPKQSLDRSLDLELEGRGSHTLYRRLALGVLGLVVLAALLGAFGQESTKTVAAGQRAVLSVDAPPRLRGGLLFQARFEVHAKRRLAHPDLVLSPGWLHGMTLNTVVPTPLSETSGKGGLTMSFEALPAGETLVVWTSWQVNPTNVGRRDEDVALFDGAEPLASAQRTVTVFP